MIGTRLAELRRRENLSQFEMAHILSVSIPSISRYERDEAEPNDQIKIAIAKYFHVSVDYLLGLTDECAARPQPVADLSSKPMKTLLFADNEDLCQKILAQKEKFQCNAIGLDIFSDMDGMELYDYICKKKPDAVVVNLLMSKLDGLAVVKKYKETCPEADTLFFLTSAYMSDSLAAELTKAGFQYVFVKPYDMTAFSDRIISMLSQKTDTDDENQDYVQPLDSMEYRVTKALRSIGVPSNLKGYVYLRDAILMAIKDVDLLNRITRDVYPSIAKKHDTTPNCVERAIRHIIEVTWSRGNIKTLNANLGNMDKPTNSEFIANLTECLREQRIQARREHTDYGLGE